MLTERRISVSASDMSNLNYSIRIVDYALFTCPQLEITVATKSSQ